MESFFGVFGGYFIECHTTSLSHTQPSTHKPLKSNKKKIPKDSALGWGSAPSLSLWDGYRLSVIKAFVMLPCCKSAVVKTQWQGAPTCEMHEAEMN